jgi:hypothetical protein
MRQSLATAQRLIPAVRLARLGFILHQTFARSQRRIAGFPAILRNLLFGTRRAKVGVSPYSQAKRKGGRQDAPDERKCGKGFA